MRSICFDSKNGYNQSYRDGVIWPFKFCLEFHIKEEMMGDKGGKKNKEKANKQKQSQTEKKQEQQKAKLPGSKKPA